MELNLLTNSQHGFIKGKSTTTAMIDLVESIIDYLDDRKFTTALLLDYSKAFDCIGHKIIIEKLEGLGITGTPKTWFESYLTGRSQLVELNHTTNGVTQTVRSKPQPMTRGVPQGSVLGPVLFILLTNDFPDYVKDFSSVVMFADDTTLLLQSETAEDLSIKAYIALNMTYDYCSSNDLAANPSKTKQINFGGRGDQVPGLPNIDSEEETKLLGLTLDAKLTWNPHIDSLCKKLNTTTYVIKRIKSVSSCETAKIAYYALMETHLRYGVILWGSTSAANLKRVLKIQKSAVRSLANLDFRDSCRPAFKQLKIKTVTAIYIQELILHVDKLGLPKATRPHNYNTRNASLIPPVRHRTALHDKKPSTMGARLYNQLPALFKQLTGKALKRKLDSWLSEHPIYTVQEFTEKINQTLH
uniref:Reverse transcriptase domain-containing protein n=1 Tax=Graphocephala atropunctata TaxID=36148 RepID=A0A1B6LUG6_9HEMI